MDLEAEPTAAILERLDAPATRVDDGPIGGGLAPAEALVQFATFPPESLGQQHIHFEPGQTKCRGHWPDGKTGCSRTKEGAPGKNSTTAQERFAQTQSLEYRLPSPTDELATDSMAWIVSGLKNSDRHLLLAQSDAQHQAGQATADDCDGFWSCHWPLMRRAMKR